MGGYDGDSRRSAKVVDSVLGGATDEMYYAAAGGGFYGYADNDHDSAMDALNGYADNDHNSAMDALMGGGWHGVGAEYENGNIMEAFGLNDGVAMDSGAGQDSADVFKHTEGGSGIYHAGNEIPRSIELPKPPVKKKPRTPDMGGGSDSGGTGGYKGGDGGVYASASEAAAHGGNYGYRASASVGAAHSSVSGHGNSAMDFMNGFF